MTLTTLARTCERSAHYEHSLSRFDLNTASPDLLAHLSDVGPARVQALVQRRPFRNWDDVERVPGISESIVERLKLGGLCLE